MCVCVCVGGNVSVCGRGVVGVEGKCVGGSVGG